MTLSAAPKFALQKVRTSQPQGPCAIDRSNPICRGLIFTLSPADAIANKVVGSSPLGSSLHTTTTDVNFMMKAFPRRAYSSLSFMLLSRTTARSSYAGLIISRDSVGAASYGINFSDGNASAVLTNSNPMVNMHGPDWNTQDTAYSSSSVNNQYPLKGTKFIYSWGIDSYSGRGRLFRDGVELTGYANTKTTLCNLNSSSFGGFLSVTAGSTTDTNLLVVWDRALSDAEIKSLSDNPWQIFNSDKPLPPLSLAPHEVVTPRKSYMLGGSSPAPSTAAILTIPRRVRTSQPQGVVSVADGWCAYNAASQSLTGFGQTVSVPNTAPRATKGGICGGAVNVNFSPLKRLSIVEDTSSTFTLVGSFVRQDSGEHTFGFSSVNGYGFGLNLISTTYASAYGTWYGVQTVNGINSWTSYGSIVNMAVSVQWISKSVYNFYTQTLYVNGKYFSSTIGAGYPEAFTKFAATDTVLMAGIRSGRLSDKQLLDLSLNPWQIFAPDNTPIWGPA